MLEKVINFIKREQMLAQGNRVILGVSGGPDSVAMLSVFLSIRKNWDLQLAVCHINHCLREEAVEEARFVAGLCQKLGVPCQIYRVDVKKTAEREGLSIQQAARKLRFRAFSRMYEQENADRLALAHHADDQAETVLLNLLRGTGPEGLAGIKPKTLLEIAGEKLAVIHPLLGITREEIMEYCRERGLEYRSDPSNFKSDYLRNKVRLELIPLLEREYNPQVKDKLVQMAEIFSKEEDFWEDILSAAWDRVTCEFKAGEYVIWNLQGLRQEKLALLRRILRRGLEIVKGDLKNIYFYHIQNMIELIYTGKVNGKVHLSGGIKLKLSYDRAVLKRGTNGEQLPEMYSVELEVPGEVRLPGLSWIISAKILPSFNRNEFPSVKNKVWVDAEKTGRLLGVRNRRRGDRFRPLGMKGEKKLKDFFIDEKVPRLQRDKIPVVCDRRGRIIWVAGYRLDERFKVTERTKKVIELQVTKSHCIKEEIDNAQ